MKPTTVKKWRYFSIRRGSGAFTNTESGIGHRVMYFDVTLVTRGELSRKGGRPTTPRTTMERKIAFDSTDGGEDRAKQK